jgi:hypothetical protein
MAASFGPATALANQRAGSVKSPLVNVPQNRSNALACGEPQAIAAADATKQRKRMERRIAKSSAGKRGGSRETS